MESKIVLIYFVSCGSQESCQKIVPDLVACYTNSFGDEVTVLALDESRFSFTQTMDHLQSLHPRTVVFLGPGPKFGEWIVELSKRLPGARYFVHIYGTFVWHLNELSRLRGKFHFINVRFLVSSKALLEQGRLLFKDPHQVELLSFPFLESPAMIDKQQRQKSRESLGLPSEDWVYLYLGRISRQKNVLELMEIFARHHETSPNGQLVIAGLHDDHHWPTTPRGYYLNYYAD